MIKKAFQMAKIKTITACFIMTVGLLISATIAHSGEEEKIEFAPGEFEKRFTIVQQMAEIILKIPFSISASHIGQIICKSINEVVGSTMVALKGIEAISNDDTKMIFVVFDTDFFKIMKQKSKTLTAHLNNLFEINSLITNDIEIEDPIQDVTDGVLRVRNIPLPLVPYEVDSKVVQQKIIEFYNRLGKIGETVYNIVSSIFK